MDTRTGMLRDNVEWQHRERYSVHRVHQRDNAYGWHGKFPGQAVIDAAAERQMYGGWTSRQRSRANQCETCFQLRSANGSCGCL